MTKRNLKRRKNFSMKMTKSNIIEIIIFMLSVTGTVCVSSLNGHTQFIGFCLWTIANVIAAFFFMHKKLSLISIQFVIYFGISLNAIMQRI